MEDKRSKAIGKERQDLRWLMQRIEPRPPPLSVFCVVSSAFGLASYQQAAQILVSNRSTLRGERKQGEARIQRLSVSCSMGFVAFRISSNESTTARMDDISSPPPRKWRKVAYGGMQPGFDDNHTDESFLEAMVTNANVVKRDLCKVMLDSVSICQYLCIVSLVVLVWTYTLASTISYNSLLLLDVILLGSGFLVILLTAEMISFRLLFQYILNISYFIIGLYALSPIYHTLTRSISSDSIWALTALLIVLHLFLHDYTGCTMRAPGSPKNPTLSSNISLNISIIASVLIASRLPSRQYVFLFAPLVMYCIKRYSFQLHLCCSLGLFTNFKGSCSVCCWDCWFSSHSSALIGSLEFKNTSLKSTAHGTRQSCVSTLRSEIEDHIRYVLYRKLRWLIPVCWFFGGSNAADDRLQ
ncbi:hypothetical protein Cgig2_028473 [Carnegiea gigantea]|uniref:Phosphatidylinositol N-acetylglucosaminyltransferase subunit C n=1 Tax=Carnegiea gigantea TaxID=171969 RepID=A0A9Q1K9A5_9CARY|nr:hypothetical protein Cgig2_028473 [Carnegiea gigantea]